MGAVDCFIEPNDDVTGSNEPNDGIGCSRSIADAPKYSDDSDKSDVVAG